MLTNCDCVACLAGIADGPIHGVWQGMTFVDDQAEHDCKVNIELLKACFVELSKESQREVYVWIYETFDYCRIYSK